MDSSSNTQDASLLRDFVTNRSRAAFEQLVRRHVDLVYSAALRQVRDPHSAEDVTQSVFALLATKAPTIRAHEALAGWLLVTTRYVAINTLRAESRRRRHEHEAAMIHAEQQREQQGNQSWDSIGSLLDEAIATLKDDDRNALALRFFQGMTVVETSDALGISREAAQKRLSRALDRLRSIFASRGIESTQDALASLIVANAVSSAPTQLSAKIAAAALTANGAAAAGTAITASATATAAAGGKLLVAGAIGAIFVATVAAVATRQNNAPQATSPTTPASASPLNVAATAESNISFEGRYGLKNGLAVHRIPPPFYPSRLEYYREHEPRQAAEIPHGPDAMIIGWQNATPRTWHMHFRDGNSGYTPAALLFFLMDLHAEEIEGLDLLGDLPIPGDYSLNLDATEDQRRAALQSILSEVTGKPITLTFADVKRTVTVLSGKWQRKDPDGKPLANPTDGVIQIYGQEYRAISISGDTPMSGLAKALGSWIKQPVVIEAEGAPALDNVRWHTNDVDTKGPGARARAHDPQLVLKHITEQTGLTPSQQSRVVRRLIIQAAAPTADVAPAAPPVLLFPNNSFTELRNADFASDTDPENARTAGGPPALLLSSDAAKPTDIGRALQSVDIEPYLGKRVRFSAYVKTAKLANWGGIMLSAYDDDGRTWTMDEMIGRGVASNADWTGCEIVADIPRQATRLDLGLHLKGSGKIWMDAAQLEVVGSDVPTTDDHNPHLFTNMAANYTAAIDPNVQRNGHPTLCIRATKPAGSWCWYGWNVRATELYRGRRIRVTAWIKTQGVTGVSHLSVWARPQGDLVRIDDPATRKSIKGTTDWKQYELLADIPADLARFDPGVNLSGNGRIWIDELKFELVADDSGL